MGILQMVGRIKEYYPVVSIYVGSDESRRAS